MGHPARAEHTAGREARRAGLYGLQVGQSRPRNQECRVESMFLSSVVLSPLVFCQWLVWIEDRFLLPLDKEGPGPQPRAQLAAPKPVSAEPCRKKLGGGWALVRALLLSQWLNLAGAQVRDDRVQGWPCRVPRFACGSSV